MALTLLTERRKPSGDRPPHKAKAVHLSCPEMILLLRSKCRQYVKMSKSVVTDVSLGLSTLGFTF